jgi:hypothetical protein
VDFKKRLTFHCSIVNEVVGALARGEAVKALGARNKQTYDSSEIPVELLDDCGETPGGHVEELPTPPHRLPVPSRRRVFVDGGQVAFCFVEELELDEGPEFAWAGKE